MKPCARFAAIGAVIPLFFTCQTITEFFMPDEDEVALGNKFKKQILADSENYPEYKKNSEVIDYIKTMGQKIAVAQKDRDTKKVPFSFTIIDKDTVINAFAIPGGHVFVYTGLLKAAKSGMEVAGVLAHEVGHITMRHSANRMVQAAGVSAVNQIIFGNDTSTTSAIAGLLESMLFLKFSRDDEYQADSCAVAYTIAAKYNPNGITQFFEMLKKKYGGGMGPFEVLSSHPDTDERISRTKALISKTGIASGDTTNFDVSGYTAIKSKI